MNGVPPCEVVLATHLPLLRVEDESTPFAGGDLWRMPFETFDALTAGAFNDHRNAYEQIAPVFFRIVVRPQLANLLPIPPGQPGHPRLQVKAASNDESVVRAAGLDIVARFHEAGVTPAWLALLLQAPDAALPPPRWSLSFAVADPGFGFAVGDKVARIASVQGDADVEYLITPAFETTTLAPEALETASRWAERLSEASSIDRALWPALDVLGACASPLLGASDRGVLATVGLESLLLPEVRAGMARTLSRRLAALLGGDAPSRRRLESQVRALYQARSATLHGEPPPDAGRGDADALAGPPLLAAAVLALDAQATDQHLAVPAMLDLLGTAAAPPSVTAKAARETRARAWSPPLQRRRIGMVATPGTSLESEEGSWLMWAPLAGLQCRAPMTIDGSAARMVLPLSGPEVLALEERDIRRDFAAQLNGIGECIAALCLRLDESEAADAESAFTRLQRERDLAVAALRLAGLHAFCDPALAGAVLMNRSVRLRRPTVLRQSVWQLIVDESRAVEIGRDADEARIAGPLKRLLAYEAQGRHADIERSLSLYLRGFDRRFSQAHDCAMLHFAAIESLLGRFASPGEPIQLETLVAALLEPDDPHSTWFSLHGRGMRNDIAHGRAHDRVDPVALDALAVVGGAALLRAIDLRLAAPESDERPAARLVQALASSIV